MARLAKTLGYDCLRVSTPCVVDATDYETKVGSPLVITCNRADWDTGATTTIISERVVELLGLIPIGKTKISGINGIPVLTNEYCVDLKFSDDVSIQFVKVAEAPLLTMDMLIGMNVINQGDFHLDFKDGNNLFTFEVKR